MRTALRPRRRRASLARLLMVLALVAAGGIPAGYGLAALVSLRRARMEAGALQVELIRERYGDLLSRHPDVPVQSYRAVLDAFLAATPRHQRRKLEEAQRLLVTLRGHLASVAGVTDPSAAQGADGVPLKTFSADGFRVLYESLSYAGLEQIPAPPAILGNAAADSRIVSRAEARGYRLRAMAALPDLVELGGYWMQPALSRSWAAMEAAARRDGVQIRIVSAFRSAERQRAIFVDRLMAEGRQTLGRAPTVQDVIAGNADSVIDRVLATSSIPGYSRHHTGYAVDLEDPSGGLSFLDFEKTPAFLWLSSNNYANAKRFGFIPSYPEGAVDQGPEPEPWEYVWVGEDLLTETW